MSMVVVGKVTHVNERQAGNPGNEWTERTLKVEDWGSTEYVTVGRELEQQGVPAVGDQVAIVCAVRLFERKNGAGLGSSLTGLRRHEQVTGLLESNKGVRAAV